MGSVAFDALTSLARLLPAALARVLLVCVILVALALHLRTSARIEALEISQVEMRSGTEHLIRAVDSLADEVRGYRSDLREENKLLKRNGARR